MKKILILLAVFAAEFAFGDYVYMSEKDIYSYKREDVKLLDDDGVKWFYVIFSDKKTGEPFSAPVSWSIITNRWEGRSSKNMFLEELVIPREFEGAPVRVIPFSSLSLFSNIRNVTIPDTIESLNSCAFSNKTKLEKVELPNSIKYIDADAFANCRSLKEISIPEGITRLKYSTFANCRALEKINLPHSLKTIDRQVFQNCASLKEITLPTGMTSIEELTFDKCKSLKEIVIPEGVEVIKRGAFQDCTSLEKVVLPSTLKDIKMDAFSGCSNLKDVVIPESVSYVDAASFKGCAGELSLSDSTCMIDTRDPTIRFAMQVFSDRSINRRFFSVDNPDLIMDTYDVDVLLDRLLVLEDEAHKKMLGAYLVHIITSFKVELNLEDRRKGTDVSLLTDKAVLFPRMVKQISELDKNDKLVLKLAKYMGEHLQTIDLPKKNKDMDKKRRDDIYWLKVSNDEILKIREGICFELAPKIAAREGEAKDSLINQVIEKAKLNEKEIKLLKGKAKSLPKHREEELMFDEEDLITVEGGPFYEIIGTPVTITLPYDPNSNGDNVEKVNK